jgi:hypothetical protein
MGRQYKKSLLRASGKRKALFMWISCLGNNNTFWPLCWNHRNSEWTPSSFQGFALLHPPPPFRYKARPHTSVSTPVTFTKFGRTVLPKQYFFFVMKPTRCTNFTHSFCHETTCFGQFLCPSTGVYSLYTRQWYMSYRFVDSFRAGPGWNCTTAVYKPVSK